MLTHDTAPTSSHHPKVICSNIRLELNPRLQMLWWFLACALSAALLTGAQLAQAATKPITDDAFVRDSFSNAQVEIAMSKVALEKSANPSTKKLAKAIIKDQGSANEKLRALASTRRLTVPTELDKAQMQQLEQLKTSDKKSFDALYRQHLQQTHVESIQLFDQVAKNPRADAELRVFASQRLPLYKKQQQMLEKIAGDTTKSVQRQAAR